MKQETLTKEETEMDNIKAILADIIRRIEALEKPNLKLLNYHTVQDVDNIKEDVEQITRYLMETTQFELEPVPTQTWTHDPKHEEKQEAKIKDGLEGLEAIQ